ncbi:major facilitator superfamily domain-containing protein [Tricladium varicosporioides]|nr:major facilitator superfamily domain-containing protein [Hymenoscyphus varicosporioides]
MPPPTNSELSPLSSSTSNTRFTPQSDEQDSDLELDGAAESYQLRPRERDEEKVWNTEAMDEDENGEEEEYTGETERRRGSISTVQSYQLYTPDEERAVVRKFDRKLVLFVALLYMLSFLDRSNIGNAKIAGLDLDLSLDSKRYEWVITAFYIAYIFFEWMSILWKIIPAHIYVTAIVLSWGLVASLQSVATSFAGLLVLRVLLGIGEAGFTGIPFYLSFFFKREELALRTGYFISAAPLATSFASTLAWAIIALGKHIPIAPWRLLFLLEGFPSVLVAVVAWNIIPDSPQTAPYLTRREKKIARWRLRCSTPSRQYHNSKSFLNTTDLLHTLTDPKTHLTSLILFLTNLAFSSLPVFLPTIVHEMHHSVIVSQALSAPPYILSFIVVLLTAHLSDKYSSRSIPIIFHAFLSTLGYGTLYLLSPTHSSPINPTQNWIRYTALFPASTGFFSVVTLIITWSINNQSSDTGKSVGFAVMQILGQLGAVIGTRLYPEEEAPGYKRGMGVCALAMVGVGVCAGCLRWWLGKENRREKERVEYGKIGDGGDGDGSRGKFVYML